MQCTRRRTLSNPDSNSHRPIHVAVIDTETTGLDPRTHEVVEVAALVVKYDPVMHLFEATHCFHTFVRPKRPIPAEATKIHGITDAMVADAPVYEAVLAELGCVLADVELYVAHNASFDKGMLPGLLTRPWLDTLHAARRFLPSAASHRNDELYQALRLTPVSSEETEDTPAELTAHRAAADAAMTAALLQHLCRKTAMDPVALHTALQQPHLQTTCNFGKHKGLPWSEVPLPYLRWVAENFTNNPDVLATVQHHLAMRDEEGERAVPAIATGKKGTSGIASPAPITDNGVAPQLPPLEYLIAAGVPAEQAAMTTASAPAVATKPVQDSTGRRIADDDTVAGLTSSFSAATLGGEGLCTFGKHKWTPWSKIPTSYLQWIVRELDKPHIIEEAKTVLRARGESLDGRDGDTAERGSRYTKGSTTGGGGGRPPWKKNAW